MSKSFRSKRGISSIIATLILILLTIVLIGIVWVVINNLVSNSTKQIPSGEECLSSGFQTVSFVCTQSGSDCNVTVKRISGSDAIGGMRLVFTNDNQDSNTSDSAGDILTFASKVIQVTNIGVANVTQVGSAAYFLDSSGAITPCSVLSEAVGSVNSVTGLTGTSGGGSSNGTSGGGSSGSNNTLCVPEGTTLASLCGNYQCGDLDNGTCGMVTCGSCNSQQYCDFSSHTCKDYGASCTPATNPDFSALCGNYQCGEVNNGTCPYVTCGTCGSGQYCNLVTNTCDNVSTCVQAPLDFCQAHSYQCGQFSNGTCGGSILCGSGTQSDGCNFPAVCNVTNYQCQSPIDLNSGKITSVWPSGAVRFLQGDNLPTTQDGDDLLGDLSSYIWFPGESNQIGCTQIAYVEKPQSGDSFVSLSLPVGDSVNIALGDNYDIWNTQNGCLNAAGLNPG
ncbi:MAG: archaellin/type IV pilin N-terminal domain-containing protein [Candidatus Nanoarchaeia archaeon]